jgi:uncharacterized protein YdeI (YjbR/CyaY-like superfamily)
MAADRDPPSLELRDADAWQSWLDANHGTVDGVWLRIAKKGASRTTVRYPEVLDVALCYGWIDAQRRPLDDTFFLQRFTRRGPRSRWSQINRTKAEHLIAEGRMQPSGVQAIEAARADGRWDSAYEPQSRATVPPDFQRELDRNPEAKEFFETLKRQNRYAFLYRIQDAKRPETRARRIETFIEMLNERRTFYP